MLLLYLYDARLTRIRTNKDGVVLLRDSNSCLHGVFPSNPRNCRRAGGSPSRPAAPPPRRPAAPPHSHPERARIDVTGVPTRNSPKRRAKLCAKPGETEPLCTRQRNKRGCDWARARSHSQSLTPRSLSKLRFFSLDQYKNKATTKKRVMHRANV